jgi:hypothetical protein
MVCKSVCLPNFLGRRYSAQTPIVFMHIPKAAGAALTDGLNAALTSKQHIPGFDRSLFGDFRAFDILAGIRR